jgi:hypothetical protein
MPASSIPLHPDASPSKGTDGGRPGKVVANALRNAKREAVEEAMGKGDTWCRSIINGDAGVKPADLDDLLDALGLKAVSRHKRCVDPDLLASYETIVRRVIANAGASLFDEDAE